MEPGRLSDPTYADSQAALEDPVEWMVETGDMGMDSPDKGYVGRICLRAQIQGWAQVWVCCDGKDPGYPVGRVQAGPKAAGGCPSGPAGAIISGCGSPGAAPAICTAWPCSGRTAASCDAGDALETKTDRSMKNGD